MTTRDGYVIYTVTAGGEMRIHLDGRGRFQHTAYGAAPQRPVKHVRATVVASRPLTEVRR